MYFSVLFSLTISKISPIINNNANRNHIHNTIYYKSYVYIPLIPFFSGVCFPSGL